MRRPSCLHIGAAAFVTIERSISQHDDNGHCDCGLAHGQISWAVGISVGAA